jgi:hypothetical protein
MAMISELALGADLSGERSLNLVYKQSVITPLAVKITSVALSSPQETPISHDFLPQPPFRFIVVSYQNLTAIRN